MCLSPVTEHSHLPTPPCAALDDLDATLCHIQNVIRAADNYSDAHLGLGTMLADGSIIWERELTTDERVDLQTAVNLCNKMLQSYRRWKQRHGDKWTEARKKEDSEG